MSRNSRHLHPPRRRTQLVSVLDSSVYDVPVAIVDIETTAAYSGPRRLIEVSVVRLEPRRRAVKVVLDTLVNPQQRVSLTEVHGITDAHVTNAPRFEDMGGNLVTALVGCVIAGYNVGSDISVLRDEFRRLEFPLCVPHLCLMSLRRKLGLGPKAPLTDACRSHRIKHSDAHTAKSDALASAELWKVYRQELRRKRLRTFGDLCWDLDQLSLTEPLLPENAAKSLRSARLSRLKPRSGLA